MTPSERWHNTRRALIADGADLAEVNDVLREVEVEEDGRDPHAGARKAGIPAIYHGVGFDQIERDGRSDSIAAAENWVRAWGTKPTASETEVPPGLYLWSDGDASDDDTGFGTGKTRIAAAAAQAMRGLRRVRWVNVVRTMTDLNLPFSSPTYEAATRHLRRPQQGEALVLDDIDKQPPTDRNIQPLFALLHDCVGDRVPLLITANRDPDALQSDWGERFGHAAASRIIEHCLTEEVRGRDRRLPE